MNNCSKLIIWCIIELEMMKKLYTITGKIEKIGCVDNVQK